MHVAFSLEFTLLLTHFYARPFFSIHHKNIRKLLTL